MITPPRLNLEKHQIAPLDVHLGTSLRRRRADFLVRALCSRFDGVEFEGTTPGWVPAFEEGAVV